MANQEEIDEESTTPELMEWIEEECSRVEISAICVWVNNHSSFEVATNGTAEQLVYGLRKVKPKILWKAIEAILPDDEFESEGDDEPDDDDDSEGVKVREFDR